MHRTPLALGAAAAVAGVGAVVLGEFAFYGPPVLLSAMALGFATAEAAVTVAARRSIPLAVATALLTAVALLVAAWTFTGHRLGSLATTGWVAVGLGAAVSWIRARPRNTRADSPPDRPPAASPDGPAGG